MSGIRGRPAAFTAKTSKKPFKMMSLLAVAMAIAIVLAFGIAADLSGMKDQSAAGAAISGQLKCASHHGPVALNTAALQAPFWDSSLIASNAPNYPWNTIVAATASSNNCLLSSVAILTAPDMNDLGPITANTYTILVAYTAPSAPALDYPLLCYNADSELNKGIGDVKVIANSEGFSSA